MCVDAIGGQACRESVNDLADFEPAKILLKGGRPDANTTARNDFDKTFLVESIEGLTDWGAADTEDAAEIGFPKRGLRRGRGRNFDYVLLQAQIDLFPEIGARGNFLCFSLHEAAYRRVCLRFKGCKRKRHVRKLMPIFVYKHKN